MERLRLFMSGRSFYAVIGGEDYRRISVTDGDQKMERFS